MSITSNRQELIQLFQRYNRRLGILYGKFIAELSALGVSIDERLQDNPLFQFDNFPDLTYRLSNIITDYKKEYLNLYKQGISSGVALAFAQDAKSLRGYTIYNDDAISRIRTAAITSYTNNRINSPIGLNLSQRIWNYVEQTKSEFEIAVSNVITDGLKKGTSASELSQQVRSQLINPDMMYRRYHHTVITAGGTKKDVVKWHKRVIDGNGRVRFIEAPLEQVGQGVYRSSYKNSFRLMRSEINMSYHYANNERWMSEPFVVGIRISMSPEHPEYDICDVLKGDYPKDFKFIGWHPQCLCMSSAILCSEKELKEITGRAAKGEDLSQYKSPNLIKRVPEVFNSWIDQRHDKILSAAERGTLGYYLRDNKKYWVERFTAEERKKMGIKELPKIMSALEVARIRHAKRTQEQVNDILHRWDIRKVERIEDIWSTATRYNKNTSLSGYLIRAKESILSGDKREKYIGNLDKAVEWSRIIENANLRHATRTPEQVKAIKEHWAARQKKYALIKKTANNVFEVASDYNEVDFSKLQKYILDGNFKAMEAETKIVAKSVSAIKKQEDSLSTFIPDVHDWHKQFTMAELQAVYDAVESKLQQWTSLPLETQATKLKFEAVDFLGGNMNNVQSKYKTWKVSQAAYLKKYNLVLYEIDYKASGLTLDAIKQWSTANPSCKKLAKLVEEANTLYTKKGNIGDIKAKVSAAQDEMNLRIAARTKRATKNGNNVTFDADAYSQARKNNAIWDKGNGQIADNTLIDTAEKQWTSATTAEKDAIFGYTHSYCHINEPLQGRHYIGRQSRSRFESDVNNITKYIEREGLPCDMWFTRGDDGLAVIESRIKFTGEKMPKNLQDLVGMEMQEGGFMSMGSRKGQGFGYKSVILNIYCPKGTKAAYIEPISAFGNGAGRDWDGKARFSSFSTEHETLCQRGTRMRITKVYQQNGKTYIDCEVISQEVKDLKYVPDANIGI